MIVGNNLVRSQDVLTEGIEAIQELLDRGTIDGDCIHASLARIAALKDKIRGDFPWKSVKPTAQP